MRLRFKLFILLFLILVSFAPPISAAVRVPAQPPNYVVDLAGIIDSNAEASLNSYLKELELKTSAQVIVLTITSLDGESIENFSINLAHDQWKLGQEGKDNGLLLLVATEDRKYRFEVGYGLEALLPDSLVGSIGRQYLVPYFKKGDFSTGILTSTLAVINIIATDAGVTLGDLPRMEVRRDYNNVVAKKLSPMGKLFSLLFIVAMIYFFIKHPRLAFFLLMMTMMGGGRRSGWSGGGGFGGGGGGGFGGGGASGGW
ncbi:MAG: TPM domain-containing protein [Thermodesulfobacteriota bacterium]